VGTFSALPMGCIDQRGPDSQFRIFYSACSSMMCLLEGPKRDQAGRRTVDEALQTCNAEIDPCRGNLLEIALIESKLRGRGPRGERHPLTTNPSSLYTALSASSQFHPPGACGSNSVPFQISTARPWAAARTSPVLTVPPLPRL